MRIFSPLIRIATWILLTSVVWWSPPTKSHLHVKASLIRCQSYDIFLEIRARERNEIMHIKHFTQGIPWSKYLENVSYEGGGRGNDRMIAMRTNTHGIYSNYCKCSLIASNIYLCFNAWKILQINSLGFNVRD